MFTIFYKKATYNPNRTYFQNYNRYAGCKSAKTPEEIPSVIAEIEAEGGTNVRVYDNCGRKVVL
jgi:spore maturation protein CgeB